MTALLLVFGSTKSRSAELSIMKRPMDSESRRFRLLLVIAVGLIGLVASFVAAEPAGAATTAFVSATGSDTNPCSAAAPCATITHALTLLPATIQVAGIIGDNVNIATTVTIQQWQGQSPAVVDGRALGSVFDVQATGKLTLDTLTVTGGSGTLSAGGTVAAGGGIDNRGALTVRDSSIRDNTAAVSPYGNRASGGGIANESSGTAAIIDSTIAGNNVGEGDARVAGGGIDNGGTLTITNTTITGNSADGFGASGGGVADETGGATTITDSTIAGNNLEGIRASASGISGRATTGATIVAGNSVLYGYECDTPLTSLGYNLADDPTRSCGLTQATDKWFVDPDLGPLTANGGPTETMLPAPNSPAVGVIPSPTTLNGVSVCGNGALDQRGVTRPSASVFCTIGAVEVSSPSLSGGARMAALPDGTGYWVVHPDGGVFSCGSAPFFGSVPGLGIQVNNIVGIAVTPDGGGYWLVGSDGGVFAFGDASFMGSMGGTPLNKPVVAMAAGDGAGYWLVASDGGVFAFGDAHFDGSMGGTPLNQAIVAMAADPAGGYWLVASDGGIFSFGGARFFGSMGGTPLTQPVVGLTSAPGGSGYWLVASDGGVFAFGQASFVGSLGGNGGSPLRAIVGLFSTNAGRSYTLVEASGTAHPF
jgi:hypothetical protein